MPLRTKGLVVKFLLNTHIQNDHTSWKMPASSRRFALNIVQKCLAARLRPDPLRELTALLRLPSWIKGEERGGKEARGKDDTPSFHIFWLRPWTHYIHHVSSSLPEFLRKLTIMYRSSDNPDTVIGRFSGPGEAIGVVWVCHCPDDVRTITFRLNDLWQTFLTLSRSNSKVKITGQSSRHRINRLLSRPWMQNDVAVLYVELAVLQWAVLPRMTAFQSYSNCLSYRASWSYFFLGFCK